MTVGIHPTCSEVIRILSLKLFFVE